MYAFPQGHNYVSGLPCLKSVSNFIADLDNFRKSHLLSILYFFQSRIFIFSTYLTYIKKHGDVRPSPEGLWAAILD